MSRCKSCGAEIVWVKTDKGKWIPCDEWLIAYKEDPEGDELLVIDNGETVRCRTEFDGEPSGLARTAHFATCPDAEKFRRKR